MFFGCKCRDPKIELFFNFINVLSEDELSLSLKAMDCDSATTSNLHPALLLLLLRKKKTAGRSSERSEEEAEEQNDLLTFDHQEDVSNRLLLLQRRTMMASLHRLESFESWFSLD